MHRIGFLVPFGASLVAVAVAAVPVSAGDSAAFVRSATDITVKSVRFATPGTSIAGTHDEYCIVTFSFTNDLGAALVPKISHFVFTDLENRRYFGAESGDAALIGITNSDDVLPQAQTRRYTVGFRVPVDSTGTVFYDDSL